MEKAIRDILERPFEAKHISKKQGFDYVEGCNIVKRLNEAFDGDWSFETELEYRDDDFVVVKGKLTAAGVTKEQFGCDEIGRYKDDHKTKPGQIMDLGFDYKAAGTDALKKCATLFGVALHLYGALEEPPLPPEDAIKSTAAKGCFACFSTLQIKEDEYNDILYAAYGKDAPRDEWSKKDITIAQWEKLHKSFYPKTQGIEAVAKEFACTVEELVTYLKQTPGSWSDKDKALLNKDSKREIAGDFARWKKEQEEIEKLDAMSKDVDE